MCVVAWLPACSLPPPLLRVAAAAALPTFFGLCPPPLTAWPCGGGFVLCSAVVSTSQLKQQVDPSRGCLLPHLAYQPSSLLGAFHAPQKLGGVRRPYLGVGFPLRCFQRLPGPNVANQPCPWRDNWRTRGSSVPVLSY